MKDKATQYSKRKVEISSILFDWMAFELNWYPKMPNTFELIENISFWFSSVEPTSDCPNLPRIFFKALLISRFSWTDPQLRWTRTVFNVYWMTWNCWKKSLYLLLKFMNNYKFNDIKGFFNKNFKRILDLDLLFLYRFNIHVSNLFFIFNNSRI